MTSSARSHVCRDGRTEVCFRYVTARRPRRAYDVYVALHEDPRFGEIDIRHAARTLDDIPSFTSGFLSVGRLRAIAGLIGLIERVVNRDRSHVDPGALVYGGHVSFPFGSRIERATARTLTPAVGRKPYPSPRHPWQGPIGPIRSMPGGENARALAHAPPRSARYGRHA